LIASVRSSKRLHLFVCTPTKLKGDMHSPLSILRAIRSMKRDSHSSRIADYGDSLFARLKLLHFVNVRPVHRDTFRRSLLVLHTSLRVSD
jgi:hypothetical protein